MGGFASVGLTCPPALAEALPIPCYSLAARARLWRKFVAETSLACMLQICAFRSVRGAPQDAACPDPAAHGGAQAGSWP